MLVYLYDSETLEYTETRPAQIDPLESQKVGHTVYLIPAYSTTIEPLEPKEGYLVKWNGENWYYEEILVPPEPEPEPEPTMEQRRAWAYRDEVDPITAHIQRLRDENPVPEGEIAELITEREAKVQEIKARYPYAGE